METFAKLFLHKIPQNHKNLIKYHIIKNNTNKNMDNLIEI